MGLVYVDDSSYFDAFYGDCVLWNNPGTEMQAPKLAARWKKNGVYVWHPVFDEKYDEPVRQQIVQDAYTRLTIIKKRNL